MLLLTSYSSGGRFFIDDSVGTIDDYAFDGASPRSTGFLIMDCFLAFAGGEPVALISPEFSLDMTEMDRQVSSLSSSPPSIMPSFYNYSLSL